MTLKQEKAALGIAHAIQTDADQALQPQRSDLLTVQEVAKILRVDGTTVRRWVRIGALEAVELPGKVRHAYRIKREALDNALGSTQETSLKIV